MKVGVVVARFQTPILHKGHVAVMDVVFENGEIKRSHAFEDIRGRLAKSSYPQLPV